MPTLPSKSQEAAELGSGAAKADVKAPFPSTQPQLLLV